VLDLWQLRFWTWKLIGVTIICSRQNVWKYFYLSICYRIALLCCGTSSLYPMHKLLLLFSRYYLLNKFVFIVCFCEILCNGVAIWFLGSMRPCLEIGKCGYRRQNVIPSDEIRLVHHLCVPTWKMQYHQVVDWRSPSPAVPSTLPIRIQVVAHGFTLLYLRGGVGFCSEI